MESVVVNKWKAQAKIETVIDVLEGRFGAVPDDARKKLKEESSLDVAKKWSLLAGTAKPLDDFRRDAGV